MFNYFELVAPPEYRVTAFGPFGLPRADYDVVNAFFGVVRWVGVGGFFVHYGVNGILTRILASFLPTSVDWFVGQPVGGVTWVDGGRRFLYNLDVLGRSSVVVVALARFFGY